MGERPGDDGAFMTVVLADDHVLVRSGVRMLIEAEDGVSVVAEAGDVGGTLREVRAHKPDVLVLDLTMPGGSSLAAIPSILEGSPDTAIVILTMQDEPSLARAALRAGALAFVLKDEAPAELMKAVRAAATGSRYVNPQLGARIAAEPDGRAELPDQLNDREVEVLKLVAVGNTSMEIGRQLNLSVRTVENYRSQILKKTRRTSRAELVAYARDCGVVH
jgi:two-component system response regulator NreC